MLRDLIKEGGLYTVANLLTKGFSFLLLPFYTSVFLQKTVGILDIISVFGLFMTALLCFQLNQGLGRYVADPELDSKTRKKYGSTAIWFTILSYTIFTSLIVLFPNGFIRLLSTEEVIPTETFLYAVIGINLTGIFYFLGVYLRFLRKVKKFALISFSHGLLTTGLIFILVLQFDMGLNGVFIAPMISSPVLIAIQFYLLRKEISFQLDKTILFKLFNFSLPLIPAAMAYIILNFTDRIFIKEYLSFESLGVYGIGSKFTALIQIIIISISAALGPIAFHKSADANVKTDLSRIFRLFIVLGSTGVLILSLFSYETLILFTTPSYFEAASIMPILYIAVFFGGFSMFSIGLQIEKKTKIIASVVLISSVMNIGLNYLLISKYELMGAALATLISIALNNLMLFFVAQRYFKIKFEYAKIAVLLTILFSLIAGGCYVLNELKLEWYFNLLIKLGLIGTFILYLSKSSLVNFEKKFGN
jgi:O-antigen/teichoic acid export membrane protein